MVATTTRRRMILHIGTNNDHADHDHTHTKKKNMEQCSLLLDDVEFKKNTCLFEDFRRVACQIEYGPKLAHHPIHTGGPIHVLLNLLKSSQSGIPSECSCLRMSAMLAAAEPAATGRTSDLAAHQKEISKQ